ncbi:MAG: thiamine pyrophosphate-dependent enzyme [Spirochaetota bacterium]|nr:thiamine pyrophosphate-dependent enzyme [Spirochaetota bacterium]
MLNTDVMPYCPGCGHKIANLSMDKAIKKENIKDLDIVLVSDIGCCGLVDPLVDCHTIHGLHGRSSALGLGVSLGLDNPKKKVLVIMGDGGVTIGLQHLLEASRRNVNITVFVLNNMIYGMTGGQISGLSTVDFKKERLTSDMDVPNYDIVELVHKAGASYAARIIGKGDYSDKICEALNVKGFSLLEIIGLCNPYGMQKINELFSSGYKEVTLVNNRSMFETKEKETISMFDGLEDIKTNFNSGLEGTVKIIIAGAAGGGVQSASAILTKAGMMCGLNATQKGEYPITIGTGYSISEVILSTCEINYTGIEIPDVIIVTAKEGLDVVKSKYENVPYLIIDSELDKLSANKIIEGNFKKVAGNKGSTLCAIAFWVQESKIFPLDVLYESIKDHKHFDKLKISIEKASEINNKG